MDRRLSRPPPIAVRRTVARGATPRAAHRRRKHCRIFAGGRPRSRQQDRARRVLARRRRGAGDHRPDRGPARAPRATPAGCCLMRPRVLARLLQIQRALVRHGLDDFVRATHLYRPFRFLVYLSPWTWFQRSAGATRGARLRLALEELGPIFVKFGQVLSTRRDLLPVDIADELAKLQDSVPPFSSEIAVATIEATYGRPLHDIFGSFDQSPLAAGSIAQGHAAVLKNGREVLVKTLRPHKREIIERDLEVLQALATLADRYWTEARRLRPAEVVREYRKTVLDELDLMREGGNAAQPERNLAGSRFLYVPAIYW